MLDGFARFVDRGVAPQDIGFFAHGTTITTNALLEMRGAKVGMLIAEGYRAIQEVQTQARDGNPFDYFFRRPDPIAPQSLTREIPGRIDYEGNELAPLDEAAVREAARSLRQAGVESVAVCFLFSFMNPAHERAAGRILREEFPEATISLSSAVLPRLREWPRMSTTLLNAYLEPVLVRYIGDLAEGLDAAKVETPQRFLMQSNGGVMPFSAAITEGKTVHTMLSGPGRRRPGERLARPGRGGRRAGDAGHGRDQLRHRLHRGRRAAGGDGKRDRAAAHRRSDTGPHDNLGRRRVRRVGRRGGAARRRAAKRGRRSRPGLLRQGRGPTRR